jgi:hypothetical protein
MFYKIWDKIKNEIYLVFWLFIFFVLTLGFWQILFFLPSHTENLIYVREFASGIISLFLLVMLGFKYDKMKSEVYKWKNKDKIINQYNKHMFEE